MKVEAREGDLIENCKGVFFDIKGLVHPRHKIVAFPRFIPCLSGTREHKNRAYDKVYALSERFRFLKQNFPDYLVNDPIFDETLCEVPVSEVKKQYDPIEKLQELRSSKALDQLESKALQLIELLKENAPTSWNAMGISGSILAGLHSANSDVDPIVYGSKNCLSVHSTLRSLLKDEKSPFKPYNREELKSLFDFRSKDTTMNFQDFVRTESRKALQGKFNETDYFVRFVKDWSEVDEKYGDVQYKNVGHATIKGTIADDSESIFTPCTYTLEKAAVIAGPRLPSIKEIVSFRGRFCEQARNGETIIAQGKVERRTDLKRHQEHLRLLIGNKPSDYMILA